ncbi:pyridoxal phosphate-dependent transferase [Aspergillus caelatus]|uniref:Pyridoxal phosphate-dependent transferase n=1 Tax=Aspergillus caelatus TaxID=61420 RepID=A0A5N7AQB0_9EURO|nr:pyridoxal phosphate-dependent transferase [Aspergillus caelatus]KAE8370930.1 pyridoxal phosphate-dependent transferase [Aspergillus caelatus]
MRDTTEGLNNFIRSISFKPGDNVVILDSEDPNHAYGWMALRAMGLEVRQVPTIPESLETGKVVAANAEAFAPFVNDRTRAIGLSSIMFHSGQKNDVKEICNVYRPRGIHVLVDMTQQVGFAPVDVTDLNVSAAAFGFHKGLNCPTGLAALYVSQSVIEEADPSPPVVGYGAVSNVRGDVLVPSNPIIYHPNARRFEHLNVSLISCAAARKWFEFYLDVMGPENVQEHLKSLVDTLRNACRALGIKIVGPEDREHHAPHLYILDLHGAKWMEHLTAHKVYVTLYRLGNWVSFGY